MFNGRTNFDRGRAYCIYSFALYWHTRAKTLPLVEPSTAEDRAIAVSFHVVRVPTHGILAATSVVVQTGAATRSLLANCDQKCLRPSPPSVTLKVRRSIRNVSIKGDP